MERRKRHSVKRVKWWRILVGLVVVGAIGFGVWWLVSRPSNDEIIWEEDETREPTVAIVDENRGEAVSERVKEYVVRLTDDLAYEGYKISRVVLPFQKTREIDVYLEDRPEYYKLSTDRGSAVSAEDVARMARHLDAGGITAQYVDIRVEGKAFFK